MLATLLSFANLLQYSSCWLLFVHPRTQVIPMACSNNQLHHARIQKNVPARDESTSDASPPRRETSIHSHTDDISPFRMRVSRTFRIFLSSSICARLSRLFYMTIRWRTHLITFVTTLRIQLPTLLLTQEMHLHSTWKEIYRTTPDSVCASVEGSTPGTALFEDSHGRKVRSCTTHQTQWCYPHPNRWRDECTWIPRS